MNSEQKHHRDTENTEVHREIHVGTFVQSRSNSLRFHLKNPRIFVRTLLSHPFQVRCSDYRATQKGRGWWEPVNAELTTLGLKNGVNAMQNTGQASEKRSYRVILLLVVGLAAFSSAMKELNQVRDLTLEATNLVAQWKDAFAPAYPMVTVSVETCQNRRTLLPPPPPLQQLPPLPPAEPVQSDAMDGVVPEAPRSPAEAPPAPPAVRQVPKPRRVVRPARDAAEVRVLLSNDDFVEKSLKDAFNSDQSFKAFKTRNRRFIFVTPESHDVILKTLNRSVHL